MNSMRNETPLPKGILTTILVSLLISAGVAFWTYLQAQDLAELTDKMRQEESEVPENSLQDLGVVANLLRAYLDSEDEAATELKACVMGWDKERALRATQILKAKIDNSIRQQLGRRPASGWPEDFLSSIQSCADRCVCGTFADLLNAVETAGRTVRESEVLSQVQSASTQLTTEAALACARSAQQFCGSSILSEIELELN